LENPHVNTQDSITDIETLNAPWNKTVNLQNIAYDDGLNFLRMRIKEGKRFTDLELDANTVTALMGCLEEWLQDNNGKG